jgi:hypothetical protein
MCVTEMVRPVLDRRRERLAHNALQRSR